MRSLFVIALVFLILSFSYASYRHVFNEPLTELFGYASSYWLMVWAVLGWLGVATYISERTRKRVTSILNSEWGLGCVLIALIFTDALLLYVSYGRKKYQLDCRPTDLQLLVGQTRHDRCGETWGPPNESITAFKDGYRTLQSSLEKLPIVEGLTKVVLIPRENWECLIETTTNDSEVFDGCGRTPPGVSWRSSKTWAIQLRYNESTRATGSTVIAVSKDMNRWGVAIRPPAGCFSDFNPQKDSRTDRLELLQDCAAPGREYRIGVTICSSATAPEQYNIADVIELRMRPSGELDDVFPSCKPPGSHL